MSPLDNNLTFINLVPGSRYIIFLDIKYGYVSLTEWHNTFSLVTSNQYVVTTFQSWYELSPITLPSVSKWDTTMSQVNLRKKVRLKGIQSCKKNASIPLKIFLFSTIPFVDMKLWSNGSFFQIKRVRSLI